MMRLTSQVLSDIEFNEGKVTCCLPKAWWFLPEEIEMTSKTRRFMANASNVFFVLSLIALMLVTVIGILFSIKHGQYIFTGLGIVFMYLVVMGSDVVSRRYLRPRLG